MFNPIESRAAAPYAYYPENFSADPAEIRKDSSFPQTTDEVFFNSWDLNSGLQHFLNQVGAAMDGLLDFQNMGSAGPYPSEASPASLAGRFLNAVESGLPRPGEQIPAVSSESIASGKNVPVQPTGKDFMNKVENGLNQGYQKTLADFSAKEETRDLMSAVDQTHALIRQGIDAIKLKTNDTEGGAYSYQAAAFQESKDLSLKILTRDGDTVVIDIHQAQGQGAHLLEKSNGDGYSINGKQYQYINESLAVSISGNLDEDEISAINQLISNVAELAQTFYASDFEKTLSQATSLGFDTAELSGFALDMGYQRSQYAAMVEQNQPFGRMPFQGRGAEQMPAHIADYLQQAMERTNRLMNDPALARMDNPRELVRDLLSALGAQLEDKAVEADTGSKTAPGQFKRTLWEDLLKAVSAAAIKPHTVKNLNTYT